MIAAAHVEAIVREYFVTDEPFYVVRSRVVGEVVARALGVSWSPALAKRTRHVVTAMGARPICFCHRMLIKGLRPAHLTREEAREMSKRLRKNPTRGREG